MCTRTHRCEVCFEEYLVERCCDIGGGEPCEEWPGLVADARAGFQTSYGTLDPCRFCGSSVENLGSCTGVQL